MAAWPALFPPDKTRKHISRWFEEHRQNAFAHLSSTEAFTGNGRLQAQVFRCLGRRLALLRSAGAEPPPRILALHGAFANPAALSAEA